jgi:hypothetical protein
VQFMGVGTSNPSGEVPPPRICKKYSQKSLFQWFLPSLRMGCSKTTLKYPPLTNCTKWSQKSLFQWFLPRVRSPGATGQKVRKTRPPPPTPPRQSHPGALAELELFTPSKAKAKLKLFTLVFSLSRAKALLHSTQLPLCSHAGSADIYMAIYSYI